MIQQITTAQIAGLSNETQTLYVDWRSTSTMEDGSKNNPFKTLKATFKRLENDNGKYIISVTSGTYKENLTTLEDSDPNVVYEPSEVNGQTHYSTVNYSIGCSAFALVSDGPVKIAYGVDISNADGPRIGSYFLQFTNPSEMDFLYIENLYMDQYYLGYFWVNVLQNARIAVLKNIYCASFVTMFNTTPSPYKIFVLDNVKSFGSFFGTSTARDIIRDGINPNNQNRGVILNDCIFSNQCYLYFTKSYIKNCRFNNIILGSPETITVPNQDVYFDNSIINGTFDYQGGLNNIYNYNSKFANIPSNVASIMTTVEYANDLKINTVQNTGYSTTALMSQKAITDALNALVISPDKLITRTFGTTNSNFPINPKVGDYFIITDSSGNYNSVYEWDGFDWIEKSFNYNLGVLFPTIQGQYSVEPEPNKLTFVSGLWKGLYKKENNNNEKYLIHIHGAKKLQKYELNDDFRIISLGLTDIDSDININSLFITGDESISFNSSIKPINMTLENLNIQNFDQSVNNLINVKFKNITTINPIHISFYSITESVTLENINNISNTDFVFYYDDGTVLPYGAVSILVDDCRNFNTSVLENFTCGASSHDGLTLYPLVIKLANVGYKGIDISRAIIEDIQLTDFDSRYLQTINLSSIQISEDSITKFFQVLINDSAGSEVSEQKTIVLDGVSNMPSQEIQDQLTALGYEITIN